MADITRVDLGNGERSVVSRQTALRRLSAVGSGADLEALLDSATENNPAQTSFALYWPTPTAVPVEKTAGQQIAHAMWLFNHGRIEEAELATAIDDALRSYR